MQEKIQQEKLEMRTFILFLLLVSIGFLWLLRPFFRPHFLGLCHRGNFLSCAAKIIAAVQWPSQLDRSINFVAMRDNRGLADDLHCHLRRERRDSYLSKN
jgi:hypothetical protein